jgi:hypothetical protein
MRANGLGVAAAVWLCFAAFQAPFAHYHPEDPDHHHATGIAHIHVGNASEHPHEAEGPELDHGDGDKPAISQEWTPVASQRIAIVYGEVAPTAIAEVSFETEGVAAEFVVRSHDPPDLRPSSARAPPL